MPSPNQNHIVFFDTTLRDGEQSPGCTMHHEEKLRLAHQIADLGVDIFSRLTSPLRPTATSLAIRAVAHEVRVFFASPRSPAATAKTSKRLPALSSRLPTTASTSSSPPPTSISSTSSASPATRPPIRPPSRSASTRSFTELSSSPLRRHANRPRVPSQDDHRRRPGRGHHHQHP